VLSGLSPLALALLLAAGLALDLLLGEARRWHPLAGFGHAAQWIEARLNQGHSRIARGGIAWALAVLPLTGLAVVATSQPGYAAHAALLYFSLGLRSLREHSLPIHAALMAGDLPRARALTARIVSRDTATAGETDLAKAAAESLLENGNDAVFGTLFWFAVAGGPGALLFRLANTLDAMWGYRNERFNLFGRTAAHIDDGLNYAPARLTALSYVLLAPGRRQLRAWRCWRAQARHWSSPNAGPVMASGAGALGVTLGGAAVYDGKLESRPILGAGPAPGPGEITRAWQLVWRTALLWIACVFGIAFALTIIGPDHA
jgi:adenosylcobinamide-phosphate synthase